ncbi:bis(5'-nucleosyl)-tetraphosphatase (symmetrical) YqeK [Chloroflexota bacterium]
MLEDYIIKFNRTGVIAEDVPRYLGLMGYPKTAKHCTAVAAKASLLAGKFGSNPYKAEQAGYLHDISAVIPNQARIEFARSRDVDILAEEEQFPMIIHQKLSEILAREVFDISDNGVLSAIGCHTTLKAGASRLDKVVFLADKIAWDQEGSPPYSNSVIEAFEVSLDAAVLAYINYLWDRRTQLRVVHPWLIEARNDLLISI